MTIPKYLLLTSEADHRLPEETTYEFFLRIPVQSLILMKFSHSSYNTAYVYNVITIEGSTILDKPRSTYYGGWLMYEYEFDNARCFLRFDSLEEVERFLLMVTL